MRFVSRPLYLHVIDWIKEQIREGRFTPGERLPSEFELAKQLGVSRTTLREALRILEDENIVVRRHGVGTFVHPRPLFSSGIEELFSVTDMIAAHGKRPGTHYLFTGRVKAQAEDREKLNITEEDEVYVIERLRTADNEPVVYCIDKIPARLLPDPVPLHYTSIFQLLEREAGVTISYAVAEIEPVGYHEKVSSLLSCAPETSLLLLKQVHYDSQENPVLYCFNYFRADRFCFRVVRRRPLAR
ncbi:MAG: GntR family transcriptional regulator [Bacillota bacterium]|jgi:Transcriptional regulators|nr:GntR family transcriptional regulator [Bacillota bacterium]